MMRAWLPVVWILCCGMLHPPKVVEGSALCEAVRVVVEDGTVLEWDDFTLGTGERLEFILPHPEAVVVNRIAGVGRLMGWVVSNGGVVLESAKGIWVGPTGGVQAERFVGSTLRGKGAVVQEGHIVAKEVCLAGFEVQNWGEIEGDHVWLVGDRRAEVELAPLVVRRGWVGEEEDEPSLKGWLGVTLWNMPGPAVVERGQVRGHHIVYMGDYLDLGRTAWIEGDEVQIGSEGTRIACLNGVLWGRRIVGWAGGGLVCRGMIAAEHSNISAGIFLDSIYHEGYDR